MRLLDTVALVAFLTPQDKLHGRSRELIAEVSREGSDVFVPSTSLIETDLLMKIREYSFSEREISLRALESRVPSARVLPSSISSFHSALAFQEKGLDYFDSLIAALALETDSTVVTTDKAIGEFVDTEW